MDYELCLFKAMNHLRTKHPHIYITLDITDVSLKDHGEKYFIESSFDTKRGRFSIEISHHALATLDVENLSSMIHYSVLHIVYGNVLVDKNKAESPALLSIAQDAVINEEIPLFKNYKNEPELGVPVLLEHIAPHFNSRQHTSAEVYNYLYDLYKDMKLPQPIMALLLEMEKADGDKSENGEDSSEEDGNEESNEEGDSGKESSGEDSSEEESSSSKDGKPGSRKGKLSVIGNNKGHGKTKDSEGKEQSESLSELQKNIAQSLVNNIINDNQEKFIGTGSATIKRMIDEMRKSEYDFKKLFEMAVRRTLSFDKKSTWMKQNRRFGGLAKGYKPRPLPKVLILIDLSGSIGQETIKMINWQIDYLAGEFDFHACWGDTSLLGFQKITKGTHPKLPLGSAGGTDLNFFVPLEKEHEYDLIIFDTDGFIPKIKETPAQKIFCIYERGREVPGYENIFINPFA